MVASPAPERYRVVEQIGAGGVGTVFLIEDRADGVRRAMKVLPRRRDQSNLRGEFAALARLAHPNIVTVHDYGITEGGHDFFTMDFVAGPPLLEAVPGPDSPLFFPVMVGVLRALAFLHARGMVHADIKPSNILIDAKALEENPEEAAHLADFGLAADLSDPAASAARGTFPYAAPEVYAGRVDARSDLYALGVVLYEIATGQKPFPGENVVEVLRAQRRGPPRDPREISSEVSAGLAELIGALLDPVPGARPQTSDEVLVRLGELAGTDIDVTAPETNPLVDIASRVVGRERDLEQLDETWAAARKGRGAPAIVVGEAGIGKSRLLTELKLRVQLAGGRALLLSVASSGARPFGGIPELVRAMSSSRTDSAPRRRRLERRQALAPLFGERADDTANTPAARFALAEALAETVREAAERAPLLIAIDDLQEASPGTLMLLQYLARAVPSMPVLLILAARYQPRAKSAGKRADSETSAREQRNSNRIERLCTAVASAERGRRIDLPPLDASSVFRLVEESFSTEIAEQIAAPLHRAAAGNPAHVREVLQALVSCGRLRRTRGAWQLPDGAGELPMPTGARAAVASRVKRLSPAGHAALHAAAVLDATFDADEIAALKPELGLDETANALAEAAALRLIRSDPTARTYEFSHPDIALSITEELSDDERLELHARAVDLLDSRRRGGESVPPERLAMHCLELGRKDEGAAWGLRAAEARADVADHYGAAEWYDRVRPLLATGTPQAMQVDERLGDLHRIIGEISRAAQDYQAAYDSSADQDPARPRLARRLAELLRRQGRGDEARALLQRALDVARRTRKPLEEAATQLAVGEVAWYRGEYKAALEHSISGYLLAKSAGARGVAAQLGILRANSEINQGNPTQALATLDVALADAEAEDDEREVAAVLFGVGRASIHAGDYARAIRAYEHALPVFERRGLVERAAKSRNNLGAAYYYQGQWQKARESWERFRDLCERLDESSELVNALNNLGSLYRDMGELERAQETLDRGAVVAERVGHTHMGTVILANQGSVAFRLDDLAGARALYLRALVKFEQLGSRADEVETRRRLCEVDLASGRTNEALDRAIDAAREAKEIGERLEEGNLHRVAATALRQQGDLESAEWFCNRGREILESLGARFRVAEVDREAAEIAFARGDQEAAERWLVSATGAFADLGARWHLKRTRALRRSLEPATRAQTTAVESRGRDMLLEVAAVAGQAKLDRVLEIVLDRTLEVTGFDRGFILLLDPGGRPRERTRRVQARGAAFDSSDAELSGSIVRRVAASGQPIAATDVADHEELRNQQSVVALGLRQVMCAPMKARGKVIGIVYVDSQRLPHEEQSVDLPLLEGLAAQAAVAVENARLVAEDKRKTELMGILAHEIRNPLAGILGFSNPTDEEADEMTADTRKLFSHVHRDAQRLKRLVDNVLELVRYEAGERDWSIASFDLIDVLESVSESYQGAAAARRVAIEIDADSRVRGVLGNEDRITQVVANLVGNAVKFAPEDTAITLRATLEQVRDDAPDAPPAPATDIRAWAPTGSTDETREYVRLDVIDRGPGMSADVRDSLFEKFRQGKNRSKGIGLGLYISREIIERHGGSIWVESEPGHGAQFSFRIPTVGGS